MNPIESALVRVLTLECVLNHVLCVGAIGRRKKIMSSSVSDSVVVIDYGSGNIRSAAKAFEHVIAENGYRLSVTVSSDPCDVEKARFVVLPGQGAFQDCMRGLIGLDGMVAALEDSVLQREVPFLGICVGMQLLATTGHEHGSFPGLGWIPGEVRGLEPANDSIKIPHMGWNSVRFSDSEAISNRNLGNLVQGITESCEQSDSDFYFVHSFVFHCKDKQHILAETDYGHTITAMVGHNNIMGVQFHPEKSHKIGLQLIKHFLCWPL